jgi:endonuclease/exonuclease/phosphatase family metal-dependent hydrolase
MRQTPRFRCALVGLALLGACGGDDDGANPDARPRPDAEAPPDALVLPTGPVDAKVMTFNVGLIQIVKGASQRIPPIVAAVKASDADIVCFEEVYTQYTNPEAFAAMLADVYPYAVWGDQNANNLSNGLLIVSKVPLYAPHYLTYPTNDGNQFVDRAVLSATAIAEDWALHVLCTHLQPGLDTPNTTIRRGQLEDLADFTEQHGYSDGPAVLLGDFNSGPEANPNEPTEECTNTTQCPDGCYLPDAMSIAMMETDYGWTDRSDEHGFSSCTWCKVEAEQLAVFLDQFPCDGSQRIDYCFVRGLTGGSDVTAIARTMEQDPDVDIGNGERAHTLSDHYAVECTIAPPP